MATKLHLSTFVQLQNSTMKLAGFSSTTDRNSVKEALNVALERIWSMKDWKEKRRVARVNTRAPYSTGTVTTVGTTVTGVGTTFTSAMVGMYFANGFNMPWTRVAAYVSATEITLEFAHPGGDLAAGSSFVLYEGEVELDSDVDTLLTNHVTLFDENGVRMGPVMEADAEDWLFARGTGRLFAFAETDDKIVGDVHTKRIKLGRYAPDAVYTIQYRYEKDLEQLDDDADKPELPSIANIALIYGALAWLYQLDEFKDAALQERAENMFQGAVYSAWRQSKRSRPRITYIRPTDRASARGGLTFTIRSP